MSFNLEDFIPVYPEQDDPDIQYKIGMKREFLDVSAQISEPKPRPNELYMHQKAFKRYMMYQDKILNIQSVGTGKTCAMIAIAEEFKNDPNFNNKVYIILRGPSLVNEIKKQIACDCTDCYLTPEVLDSSKDDISRSKALTRKIHTRYQFRTYSSFAKEILKTGFIEEELNSIYSGCIFLVDEAHYLNEKRQSKQYKDETGEDLDIDPTTADDENKEEDYKTLWKFFHIVKRCKIILSTATPMINDVNEIANLMNLILPLDMQMPINWNYDKVTISQLEPFFRGRVSYVKAFETGADVEYEGVKMNRKYEIDLPVENQDIPFLAMKRNIEGEILEEPKAPFVKTVNKIYESQTTIYPLLMSQFQQNGYMNAVTESRNFRQSEKQAACFVFPDSSYGGDFVSGKRAKNAAAKYIKVTGVDKYELEPSFKENIKYNLEEYSSKYAFIVANELDAANRRNKGEIVGTAFCYSELKSGGGAILLGKILEEYGFELFDENISVFIPSKTGSKSFCSDERSVENIRSTFPKKLRYGLLSTTMSDEKRRYLFQIFNSPENANGEYIQIMIGTEASREGINVFSALRGYLVTPGWHPSGVHQALARFIRATSHVYLLNLVRKKLIKEGRDPAFARTQIKVYKLASIVSEQEIKQNITLSLTDVERNKYTASVDLDLYTTIEKKNISIKRMMNILKRCAFDCPIHYTRNTSGNDKDGSEKCDYEKCKYICYPSGLTNNVNEEEVDYSTFDILYSEDYLVSECRDIIVNMLNQRNSIKFNDLFKSSELKMFKQKYIIMAVDNIIKQRLSVKNRFGYPSFINMDSNYLFCQTEFPNFENNIDNMVNNATLHIYKDILFGYSKNPMQDIIKDLSVDEDKLIFKSITELNDPMDKDNKSFNDLFDKLTKKYQLEKIEQAYIDVIDQKGNTVSEAIAHKYKRYFSYTNEPKSDIFKIQKYLETTNLRRGRNRKETACPIIDYESIGKLHGPDKNGEIIYFHRLDFDTETTSFRKNAQFFNPENIRIYKPSENSGWRNTHTYECQAYKNIIRIQNEAFLKPLIKSFDYIGTISDNNEFRIIKSKDFRFDAEDKRSTAKGTVCTSFGHKFDLVHILLQSEYYHDDIESFVLPPMTKEEMITELIKTYNINVPYDELNRYKVEELRYIIKWFVSGKSKSEICVHVKELFQEQDRLIEI